MIELKNVSFSYEDSDKVIFSDLNLHVGAGECVAVLGRNGSGKSTLAGLLNGLLLPTGGDILINGMNTRDQSKLYDIRKTAGMVFQNPDNQIVSSIVEEDVAFACENMGISSAEIRKRVDNALKTVDMLEYSKHAPHLLSGGQKQRVAIAGVLAMEPQALILDEPTAMLDPKGRKEVLDTVLRLNREKNMTVLFITHHMEEAAACGRVVVLDGGKIALDGAPGQVFSKVSELRALSLDAPQTVKLLYEIDQNLDRGALSVSECADRIEQYIRGSKE